MPDDSASTLPALLAARAESAPAAPWLIYRDDLDWAWYSSSQVADYVARLAAELNVEPGCPFSVGARLDPSTLALDLAVQARGGVVVSRTVGAPTSMGDRDPIQECEPVRSRLRRWHPATIEQQHAARSAVTIGDGDQAVVLGPQALATRWTSIDTQWRGLSTVEKPVALVCGTLRDLGVRALVGWSLRRGAALALEPDASLAAQAISWVRPHLAVVPRASRDEVVAALAEQKKRWRRLVLLGLAEEPQLAGDTGTVCEDSEASRTTADAVQTGSRVAAGLEARWLRTEPHERTGCDPQYSARDVGDGEPVPIGESTNE